MIKQKPFVHNNDLFSLLIATISIILSFLFVITNISKDKNKKSKIEEIKKIKIDLVSIDEEIKKLKNDMPNKTISDK